VAVAGEGAALLVCLGLVGELATTTSAWEANRAVQLKMTPMGVAVHVRGEKWGVLVWQVRARVWLNMC
jgi:hypothetical protein